MSPSIRPMTSVYLIRDESFLLLYRQGGRVVSDVWTGAAGGHFEEGEMRDPRACLLREMREEIGLTEADIEDLALRYITLRYVNGEIRQNYYFFARLKDGVSGDLHSTEGTLRWIPFTDALPLAMPVSAKYVVEHYLNTGRFDNCLRGGISAPDGTQFVCMDDTV
ncbi:MAG: NUDIX domain-containing protein [Ruminococcaceae bacterium]|nr:NUDIX domain-containing protein [Oscillospiraceae bacterium]